VVECHVVHRASDETAPVAHEHVEGGIRVRVVDLARLAAWTQTASEAWLLG
jgi:hypothetical protein